MSKLKPFYTDEKCINDLRQRYIKHPLIQPKVRISPAGVVGTVSVAFLRGNQAGVHDAYETLRKKYPKAAKALLDAYGMNRDGSITV